MPGIHVTKAIDLDQLTAEMTTAGVALPTGLGMQAGTIFTYDGTGDPTDLPTGADAVIAAHTPNTALRDQLVSVLTSTVGVVMTDLTNAQRLALVAALLYKAGGLNRQGQVRPLNQWLIG